ncbi:MAG: hypothetical protein SOY73_14245 [Blautia sp.]|nr:hypothetical protein [Blautia sp.]
MVIFALAVGAFAGTVNGFIICKTRMWPFIVTLAMAEILSGIASTISTLGNGMNLLGISSYLQSIAKGIIILLVVYVDIISTKKMEKTKA